MHVIEAQGYKTDHTICAELQNLYWIWSKAPRCPQMLLFHYIVDGEETGNENVHPAVHL